MQHLDVTLLETKGSDIAVIDTTSYPVDASNLINRAFIEYLVKDDVVVFSRVHCISHASDIITETTLPIESDGIYTYYKLVIPTLEFYRTEDLSYILEPKDNYRYFYHDEAIYKTTYKVVSENTINKVCTKVTSIDDMWNARNDDDNIMFYRESFYSIWNIKKCFIARAGQFLTEAKLNGCIEECADDDEVVKKDFLMGLLIVLEWLNHRKRFSEIDRILNMLKTCDGNFLCPGIMPVIEGGCNCGKS